MLSGVNKYLAEPRGADSLADDCRFDELRARSNDGNNFHFVHLELEKDRGNFTRTD